MAETTAASRMKRKDYEKELRKLQVELCHLQEWVKTRKLSGRSSCSRAATPPARAARSRRSPSRSARASSASSRCPRLPTAKRRQMFLQRYMQHFPAAGEIVIFDRSWYNRAGVEYVMGFCTAGRTQALPGALPADREIHRRRRHHPDQGLARSRHGGAGASASGARIDDPLRQWKLSPMDVQSYRPLVRLLPGARHDVQGDQFKACALVRHPLRRQATRAAQLHLAHPEIDTLTSAYRREQGQAAETVHRKAATTTRPSLRRMKFAERY